MASHRRRRLAPLCRSVKTLRAPFVPDVTQADIGAAALQYVRKVSGFQRPAPHNTETFDRAVESVANATRELLDDLVVRGRSYWVLPTFTTRYCAPASEGPRTVRSRLKTCSSTPSPGLALAGPRRAVSVLPAGGADARPLHGRGRGPLRPARLPGPDHLRPRRRMNPLRARRGARQPHSQCQLPPDTRASHLVPEDAPEAIVATVLDFLPKAG